MKKLRQFLQVLISTGLMVSLFYLASGNATAAEKHIVIQKGDTLYRISKQYDVSVAELKTHNKLDSNMIYVGQKLYIPEAKPKLLYVVNAGSFSAKANAEKMVALLKEKEIVSIVVKTEINNKDYYRVQAGAFSNKNNAEKQKKRLQDFGIADAYILTKQKTN